MTHLRSEELLDATALRSQELRLFQIGIDDDDAVVVEVGDDDAASGGETDAPRRIEVLPHGAGPFEPVLVEENALGGEELDAVVAGVRHDDLTVGIAGDVPGVVELPVSAALLAKCEEEGPIHFEDLQIQISVASF